MGGARLGVLGGTFDPPHLGHLHLAARAREELALDQVLFVPAGEPPHKTGRSTTPVVHRLAMLLRAVAAEPAYTVDRSDVDRPPPHYTSDLLPLLQERHPDARLWLIVGGDSLRDLPTWHMPQAIIARWRIAALPRPGALVAWSSLTGHLPGLRARVDMLAGAQLDISASAIRAALRAGRRCDALLPAPVLAYIERHGLYRA